MMASRAIGYVLLAVLVGAVLLSLLILGVQWVRSADDKSHGVVTPTVRMVQEYNAPEEARIVYYTLPDFTTFN